MPNPTTIGLFALAAFAAILFLFSIVYAVIKTLQLSAQSRSRDEVLQLMNRAEKAGQDRAAEGLNSDLIRENGLVKELREARAGHVALAFFSALICATLLGIWYFTR